jgi:hypothetical protein
MADIERDAESQGTTIPPQRSVLRSQLDLDAITPADPFSNAYAIDVPRPLSSSIR